LGDDKKDWKVVEGEVPCGIRREKKWPVYAARIAIIFTKPRMPMWTTAPFADGTDGGNRNRTRGMK